MNNNQELINFTVQIELDSNDSANFTYFRDGKEVSGGGVVRTDTAGIYTLEPTTLTSGFLFTGATITNKKGNCAGDFSYKVSDDGQSIIITDTNENNGTVCLIFNVECNGKAYESADPQVKNEDEF